MTFALLNRYPAATRIEEPDTHFDVVLPAANTRASEVLALLEVGGDRDVGHRILHGVVVPRRADRDVAGGLESDAGLAAEETLGAEILVRQRADAVRRRTGDRAR